MVLGQHSRQPGPTRYEELLAAGGSSLSSALASGARAVRSTEVHHRRERALLDVASGAAAPLLVGYVLWVLHRARVLGLERLYFVARDGEVLLDIARRLRDEDGPELVYLHGSRQSWYPAGVDPDDPKAAVEALRHRSDDSLHSLLNRCGVDPLRWLEHEPTEGVDSRDRDVLQRLLDDPAFLVEVTDGLRGRQDRLRRYLEQNGLTSHERSGIVDLGWYGRSLHHLSRLLGDLGAPTPVGFYLGFIGEDPVRQPVETWLEGREDELRFLMMEAFCAGSHGQVLDYVLDDHGRATAVLASERNEPALSWGLQTVRGAVATVTDVVAAAPREVRRDDVRAVAMECFRAFYDHPTKDEAQVWGAFPFEVGPTAVRPEVLAERRPLRVILANRRLSDPGGLRWPAGDHVLSPRAWRVGLAVHRSLRGRTSAG